MERVFINEAFTKAINDYLATKDKQTGLVYDSFLVGCIRLLNIIYSEADIINPYNVDNAEILKNNLKKFGYPDAEINRFFTELDSFYKIDQENEHLTIKKDNPYFVSVQKILIDMLIAKKLNFHLLEQEIQDFYEILYTPDSKEPLKLSYNYLMAKSDPMEIKNYFNTELSTHEKIEEEATKNFLNNRSYEIMGLTMDYVRSLSIEELEKLNHQVYDYFKIRENAINKEYLLEKAIEEHDHANDKMTSGNGYVDILLIMGVITTLVMLGVIIRYLVF